jgi:hypothetical protein
MKQRLRSGDGVDFIIMEHIAGQTLDADAPIARVRSRS